MKETEVNVNFQEIHITNLQYYILSDALKQTYTQYSNVSYPQANKLGYTNFFKMSRVLNFLIYIWC